MKFPDWLTLLFIGLKLTGQITWSWIWVLSPIWLVTVAGLLTIVLGFLLKKPFK
jgi:hypothetical protein